MFYNRTTNNKINKLHERALRLVYDDYLSAFEELLKKDNSFTVHHYNIRTLYIELYKVFRGQSQIIFSDLFERKNINCSLRYFGPIIWNLIAKEIKICDTLASFVNKIRQWRPNACPCKICKNFIPNVRFIETN